MVRKRPGPVVLTHPKRRGGCQRGSLSPHPTLNVTQPYSPPWSKAKVLGPKGEQPSTHTAQLPAAVGAGDRPLSPAISK